MKSGAVSSASKSSPPTQVISSSVNSALVLFLTPLFPKKKKISTKENMNLPVIITSLLGLIDYVLQLLKSLTFKPYHSQDLIY